MLQNLVVIANSSTIELGITLYLGGSVVSGTLIGGKQYFEALGELLDAVVARDVPAAEITETRGTTLASAIRQMGVVYDRSDPDVEALDRGFWSPQFLHLRDARVWGATSSPIPTNGTLWRGRLSSIVGFSLGILQPGKAP